MTTDQLDLIKRILIMDFTLLTFLQNTTVTRLNWGLKRLSMISQIPAETLRPNVDTIISHYYKQS